MNMIDLFLFFKILLFFIAEDLLTSHMNLLINIIIPSILVATFLIIVFRQSQKNKQLVHQINILKEQFKEDISLSQYSIDHSADLIFWANKYGDIIYVNNTVIDRLGYSNEEIQESKIQEIFREIPIEKWQEYWKRLKSEKHFVFESVIIDKNHTVIPVEISVNYYIYEGVEFNFIFARDIAKRIEIENKLKHAKEQAELSEKIKTSFLANMSHEIRTPMTAIVGFSDLLLDSDLSYEQKAEIIFQIKSNSGVLLNLVNDIIDLSLIEAGDLKLNKAHYKLNDLLRSIYKIQHDVKLTQYENASSVDFKLNVNKKLDNITIHTDSLRFRQVFSYLIKNSFKFTHKGNVTFGYEIKENNLYFYVKDTGVGIPKDKQKEVFDSFKKVEFDPSKIHQGTGLGLTIAKKLIELLNGYIWFDSEPDKGTAFYFSMPIENLNVSTTKKYQSVRKNNWEGKTFLIVEDLDYNYELIQAALKSTKANLLRAIHGKEAIDLYKKENSIDLILMDIRMHVMNGYEATKEIKKINHKIPIIAQTAYAFVEEREKCIQVGCDDYITKPINKLYLIEVIEKYLS